MKRFIGIIILIILIGGLTGLVYWDVTSHMGETIEVTESVPEQVGHYIVHIMVCLAFCTIAHKPVHKFWNWLMSLVGIKTKDDCKSDCH